MTDKIREALAELVACSDENMRSEWGTDPAKEQALRKRFGAAWATAREALAEQPALLPSEAVYAFAAWLTCSDRPVIFGSTHDASIAAELVDSFVKSQGLAEPREDYVSRLAPYPTVAIAEQPAALTPLTNEQITDIWNASLLELRSVYAFARAIERAHGISFPTAGNSVGNSTDEKHTPSSPSA